ncbi:hypothetical protein [Photobacterium jeanii]|uniref:hypothetical protein n=1 Tax=Photobacterium jeanii TaxID=858640 RepID=UPI0011B2352E|nr:hypothetical protein [Photobacterium jeanii]
MLSASPLAIAAAVDVDVSYYSKATFLVQSGRYRQAADQYHRLAIMFLSSEAKLGSKQMWQYAGLAEALAAIAADKNNSAKAYQYWADSTRYLMTGGTNWEQMKHKLHMRYEVANTQLSTQLQVNDFAATIDEHWQNELTTMQAWDEKLSFFSFSSPKLGMMDHQAQSSLPTSQTQPTYRPPQPAASGKSLGGAGGGKKLSGLNTRFTQTPNFEPVPQTTSSAVQPTKTKVESPAKTKLIPVPAVVELQAESAVPTKPSDPTKIVTKAKAAQAAQQTTLSSTKVKEKTQSPDVKGVPVTPNAPPNEHIVVSPVEAITYHETNLNTGKVIQPSAHPSETTEQSNTPNPMAKGNMAVIDESTVTPLQRRSFAPVPVESTE